MVIFASGDSETLRTNKKCHILQYCALAVYTWIYYYIQVEEKYPWISPDGEFSILPTCVVKLCFVILGGQRPWFNLGFSICPGKVQLLFTQA